MELPFPHPCRNASVADRSAPNQHNPLDVVSSRSLLILAQEETATIEAGHRRRTRAFLSPAAVFLGGGFFFELFLAGKEQVVSV